jgi:hypothetical protein
MRGTTLAAAIVAAVLVAGWVDAAPKPSTVVVERVDFVGVSDDPLNPAFLGRLEANAHCQAIWTESRVCNVEDLSDSLTLTIRDIPAEGAWFFPKLSDPRTRPEEFLIGTVLEFIMSTGETSRGRTELDLGTPNTPRPFACCGLVSP